MRFAGLNMEDYGMLFDKILEQLHESNRHKAVRITAQQCSNIKSAVKAIVTEFLCSDLDEDAPDEEWKPSMDLEKLRRWYVSQKQERTFDGCLVIVMPDLELFSQQLIQTLLQMCKELTEVPIVFLFGISSSFDMCIKQTFPLSLLESMKIESFPVESSDVWIDEFVKQYLVEGGLSQRWSHPVMSSLLDYFQDFDRSVNSFVCGLQYLLMDYYFSNPCSILYGLLDDDPTEVEQTLRLLTPDHIDSLRSEASFRRYIDQVCTIRLTFLGPLN